MDAHQAEMIHSAGMEIQHAPHDNRTVQKAFGPGSQRTTKDKKPDNVRYNNTRKDEDTQAVEIIGWGERGSAVQVVQETPVGELSALS